MALKLKARYRMFKTLKNQSGFGWDEINKTPTAEFTVWEDLIAVSGYSLKLF